MNDLDRLRVEYAERRRRSAGVHRYSTADPAYRFFEAQRKRSVQSLLAGNGRANISNCRILEVGCGNGSVLIGFRQLGADQNKLFGIDLLPERLRSGHHAYPSLKLVCADGQDLPYPAIYFDLVLQYTAFSSILDVRIKANMAREMSRVVKTDGVIVWYDFWFNPTNHQTRGIRPSEIRHLFAGCRFEFHRITLAPPIARKLATVSWRLCLFLESLKIFNTHYLVLIRPGD